MIQLLESITFEQDKGNIIKRVIQIILTLLLVGCGQNNVDVVQINESADKILIPKSTSTITLVPTASATSIPTKTPGPTEPLNPIPNQPNSSSEWIPELVNFLNQDEGNLQRIPTVLASWEADVSPYFGGVSTEIIEYADLNGDQSPEIILAFMSEQIENDYCGNLYHVAIVHQSNDSIYSVSWDDEIGAFYGLNLYLETDVNGDGLVDLAISTSCGGNNSQQSFLYMIGWTGANFELFTDSKMRVGHSFAEEFPVPNTNGLYEVSYLVGGYGVFPQSWVETYTWNDKVKRFDNRTRFYRPQGAEQFSSAAAQFFEDGQLDEALQLHLDALQSADATGKYDRQQAFSEFQLVLIYVILEDLEEAKKWALSNNFATEPYSLAKEQFWLNYTDVHSYNTAAQAARDFIILQPENAQLYLPPFSSVSDPLFRVLDEIIPCDVCSDADLLESFFP